MYFSLCENDWDHFCLLKYLNHAGIAGGVGLKVSKALWMYCNDQISVKWNEIGYCKWNKVPSENISTAFGLFRMLDNVNTTLHWTD